MMVFTRFNPQPRVAADLLQALIPRLNCVSIHSRAWRLTVVFVLYGGDGRFNPQPRVAADQLMHQRGSGTEVSIHSRAWRLT